MKSNLTTFTRSHFAALGVALSLAASIIPVEAASVALPIRNRNQWLENNGYCGEMSLQECALYFGIYASQFYIRNIIDPTQQNDLVELDEWAQVLATLGLKAHYFPTDSVPAPQYKTFEVWAKQQLARRRPVIGTCYVSVPAAVGVSNPTNTDPVDHIITLTSFTAARLTTYSDDDTFVFNHHLAQTTQGLPGAPSAFVLRSKWLFDERSMSGPGATYGYSIQKEVNYALALLGTTNVSPYSRPVRVELDRITEPNLIVGETPVGLKAEITIENLTRGANYVLYRYNEPATVPTANYTSQPSSSKVTFTATNRTQVLTDTIQSNGIAIYRCLPAGR